MLTGRRILIIEDDPPIRRAVRHAFEALAAHNFEAATGRDGLDLAAADAIRELVARHTGGHQLGFLGEERVNVLLLNLALDSAFTRPSTPTGAR